MRILAVDTSCKAVSVAIVTDGGISAKLWFEHGKTHSQTLMPAIDTVLTALGVKAADIDCFAAVTGPGSFTGLRIGIATVQMLALAGGVQTVGVSSLDALAYNLKNYGDCILCPMIDARNDQVFTAVYRLKNRQSIMVMAPTVLHIQELADKLTFYQRQYQSADAKQADTLQIVLNGDAAQKHLQFFLDYFVDGSCYSADERDLYQDAVSAAMIAYEYAMQGKLTKPEELIPDYLRESGAKRLLMENQS